MSSPVRERHQTPEESPLVGVVILHWNDVAATRACLASLETISAARLKVLVVDNGSLKPLAGQLAATGLDLTILAAPENLGFAAGCNLGLREALAQDCEFVWLLNNDTEVDRGALAELLATARAEPAAGLIGSSILDREQPALVNHLGVEVLPARGLCRHIGRGAEFAGVGTAGLPSPAAVTGCSVLARLEMVRDVGLLDEGYFLYWEDADWCRRVRDAGWGIAMAYGSIVYHTGSGGLGAGTPLKSYYLARNSLRYVARHHRRLLPLALVWWPRRHFLNHLFKGRFTHAALAVRAVFDGLRGEVLVPEWPAATGRVQRRKRMLR